MYCHADVQSPDAAHLAPRLGLRPEEVAYRAKMSASYLRTLEDRGGNPSASVLGRLAAVYGRSLDELFTFDSAPDAKLARRRAS